MTDPIEPGRRRQSYASPPMQERRHRILVEARALLAEGGRKGFSIRELSRRAAVSSRTLYSAFGDKDGILSAAVGEHIVLFGQRLAERSRGGALAGILAEFDDVAAEVARTPAYTRILIELYYSLTPLEPALDMIRELPAGRLVRWLDDAPPEGILPSLDRAWIVERHVDNEIAIFHHWAVGRIAIDDLADVLRRNFVATLAMITCGPCRAALVDATGAQGPAREAPARAS